MSRTVVEVVHGKYCKYEIVRETKTFSIEIKLYKDGKYVGQYRSVEAAVKAANEKG